MNDKTVHTKSNAKSSTIDQEFDELVCEISAKLEIGDSVDLAEYQRHYPEHGERLKRLWPTLMAMMELGHMADLPASQQCKSRESLGGGILG